MDIQFSEEISAAYLSVVRHILENEEFLSLCLYSHHQWTNRLMHSVNVSYISWKIAKKLGCDEKAAARAGLLHDFCPYDFSEKTRRRKTAFGYLISVRVKRMPYGLICFRWDLFRKTAKHGLLPWQIRYVRLWSYAILP